MKEKVLVVDDLEKMLSLFKSFLSQQGYDVTTACNYSDAIANMAITDFDLVLTDIELGDDNTGIDILKEVKRSNPACAVILYTGNPDILTVSDARRMGAYDCLYKPLRLETLSQNINMALLYKTASPQIG